MRKVTDLISKVLDLVKVADSIDSSSKVGRIQLYQLSNRVKHYTRDIDNLVLSTIYEVRYSIKDKTYFARLTNVSESEAKGVIVSLWKLRKVNKEDIHFLEINKVPTSFF